MLPDAEEHFVIHTQIFLLLRTRVITVSVFGLRSFSTEVRVTEIRNKRT